MTIRGPFREYSDERGLWHGAKVATHQDLSGLFLVRAVERYLKIDGRFAFVMPNAAVDRGQFKGLRTGLYKRSDSVNPLAIAFDFAWTSAGFARTSSSADPPYYSAHAQTSRSRYQPRSWSGQAGCQDRTLRYGQESPRASAG